MKSWKRCKCAVRATILLSLVSLTGCESFDAGLFSRTAAEGVAVDVVVQTGLPQSQVRMAELTETDLTVLDISDSTYNDFRNKWQTALGDPEYLAVNVLSFGREFDDLKAAYLDYRQIVSEHWDEYPSTIQSSFDTYDESASRIDTNVSEMLEGNSIQSAVLQALQYASLAAQLGLL